MRQRPVLYGTTNPAKFQLMQSFAAQLPIQLLSPRELGIDLVVEEDGQSPAENACKKAAAYFAWAGIPTIALDAGLTIDKFPIEKQPGVFVRRIHGAGREVSDEEMVRHYCAELERVGGQSPGQWQVAVAFANGTEPVRFEAYAVAVLFTTKISPVRLAGAPLSSLMCDPQTGRYFAEMSPAERPDNQQVQAVLTRLLCNL